MRSRGCQSRANSQNHRRSRHDRVCLGRRSMDSNTARWQSSAPDHGRAQPSTTMVCVRYLARLLPGSDRPLGDSQGWLGAKSIGAAVQALWSPSTDRLAFVSGIRQSRTGLSLADPATGSVEALVPAGDGVGGTGVLSLAWSPDGEQIAYSLEERSGARKACVAVHVSTAQRAASARIADGTAMPRCSTPAGVVGCPASGSHRG